MTFILSGLRWAPLAYEEIILRIQTPNRTGGWIGEDQSRSCQKDSIPSLHSLLFKSPYQKKEAHWPFPDIPNIQSNNDFPDHSIIKIKNKKIISVSNFLIWLRHCLRGPNHPKLSYKTLLHPHFLASSSSSWSVSCPWWVQASKRIQSSIWAESPSSQVTNIWI